MPLTHVTTTINLEMSGDTKRYLVSAKQGDKATRFIVARLMNNGVDYIIPAGSRAIVNFEKPDGKHVYNTCTYSGSEVTIELTNQALAAAGTLYCDVEIRTNDNTEVITSVSFTVEVEKTMRNDEAILSSNEFTELESRIGGHIDAIDATEEEISQAESARSAAEQARATAETARATAEQTRQQNENTRIMQETGRQRDTAQAIRNAEEATASAIRATDNCTDITAEAESALQNQEQLESTLNTVIQLRQEVSQMQQTVTAAKNQVEQDKQDIDRIIEESLLSSAESILESVQSYFNRAEALYSSMYIDCDGETPYLRAVSIVFIDGGTPQTRNQNEGIDFDGGTPASRLLAS